MAENSEQGGPRPDLELPKLFGRKKKKDAAPAPPAEDTVASPDVQPEPERSPEPVAAVPPDQPTEDDEPTRRLPPVPPPTAAAPPATEPPVEPVPTPTPEPMPAPQPVPPAPEPPPAPRPVPTPGPEPIPEPIPDPQPDPSTDPIRLARESMAPAASTAAAASTEETTVLPGGFAATTLDAPEQPAPLAAEEPTAPPKPKRERKKLTLPRVNPYLAAVVVGAVCGLTSVLLEILTQRGCESVRGVGSCGGLGLVALLVILAIEIGIGAVLLRAFGVKDPTSTSFLGVGIVAVLALVFFLHSLDSAWMFLVLPVLTAICFAISYWVTDAVVSVPRDEDTTVT